MKKWYAFHYNWLFLDTWTPLVRNVRKDYIFEGKKANCPHSIKWMERFSTQTHSHLTFQAFLDQLLRKLVAWSSFRDCLHCRSPSPKVQSSMERPHLLSDWLWWGEIFSSTLDQLYQATLAPEIPQETMPGCEGDFVLEQPLLLCLSSFFALIFQAVGIKDILNSEYDFRGTQPTTLYLAFYLWHV